jgi:hypothetical protein
MLHHIWFWYSLCYIGWEIHIVSSKPNGVYGKGGLGNTDVDNYTDTILWESEWNVYDR